MNVLLKKLLLMLALLGSLASLSAQPAIAAPNTSWVRVGSAQGGGYRMEFEVRFNQVYDASRDLNVTTCDVVLTKAQVRVFPWVWANLTPGILGASGSFSGPRSPFLQNGAYGYLRPNPFSIAGYIGTSVRHFVDESPVWMAPYTMTHGIYSYTLYLSAGTWLTAYVIW